MIRYVLYHPTWKIEDGFAALIKGSQHISIEEYDEQMKGKIFCPKCKNPTFKTPTKTIFDRKGRRFFSHNKGDDECEWRIAKVIPFYFNTEEDVDKAIADRDLVVIQDFMSTPPENLPNGRAVFYNEVPLDREGDHMERPLARHVNPGRAWPTTISTVRSIARGFDRNLSRYYSFPENPEPVQLRESLHNILDIPEEPERERKRLYYGRIEVIVRNPNIVMIWLNYPRNKNGHADFCIKTTHPLIAEYGINDDHVGRYLLFYGKIQNNGVGLCVFKPTYGEIAVLPQNYNEIIEAI